MPEDHDTEADARQHESEEERRRKRNEDEGQETHSPPPDPGSVDASGQSEEDGTIDAEPGYTPDDLTVPDVSLEAVSEAESIEPATAAPSIEQVSRDITVPELPLPGITLDTDPVDVEAAVPDIGGEEKDWQIPLVQLGSASPVQFHPSSFDTEIREPERRRRRQLTAPLYRRVSSPRIRFDPALDEAVDDEIRRRLERRELSEAEPVGTGEPVAEEDEAADSAVSEAGVSTTESAAVADSDGNTGGTGEIVPTFQEIIYNGGGVATASEGTTIVLFNEVEDNSYVGSFVTLCRRIYRETHGGHPDFQPINELDEINKREIEKWLEADKKVIYIDLDDRERRVDEEKLREKLEATIGEFGFIIFKATDPDLVDEYRTTLNEIRIVSPHSPLDVVEVTPRQPGFESERRITELCWGNLDLTAHDVKVDKPAIERLTGPGIFDDLFNRSAPKEFEDSFDAIKSEERGLFKRFTTENQGQIQGKERDDAENGESPRHYNIKTYVVRHLVQRLRERGGDIDGLQDIGQWIETERERGGVIPDVFVPGQQQAYEVETLFGGGQEPTKKIDRTIEKYDESDLAVDTVHIILENFTFLRQLDELSNIQHHHSDRSNEEDTPTVEFKTLDFQSGGLLTLSTVIEEVQDLNTSD